MAICYKSLPLRGLEKINNSYTKEIENTTLKDLKNEKSRTLACNETFIESY